MTVHQTGGRAVLEVADAGPGIEPADAERIFERFYRADPSRARDRGGSGLGLSIVAAIAAAHGGSASAANVHGGGAAFTIDLPALVESTAPQPVAHHQGPPAPRAPGAPMGPRPPPPFHIGSPHASACPAVNLQTYD